VGAGDARDDGHDRLAEHDDEERAVALGQM
jgi:hypothetical protein